jgi:hypothetical protein
MTALGLHLIYGAVLGYYFGRLMNPTRVISHEETETIPDSRADTTREAHRRRPLHQR